MEDIPVFAKAGAIVPLAKKTSWGGIDNPENIELYIFAGNNNSFELYEDDGETLGYTEGNSCITKFMQKWHSNSLEFTIDATVGDFSVIPQQREYKAIFVGVSIPEQVVIRLNGDIVNVDWEYDQYREMLMLNSLSVKPSDCISIVLSSGEEQLLSKRDRVEEKYHETVKGFRISYLNSWTLYRERLEYIQKPEKIVEACGWLTASQMRALIEVISKKVL